MMNATSYSDQNDSKPQYFNLISKEDQDKYSNLRSTLSSHVCRNRRGKRLETFAEMLNAIQIFCIRGDSDDWKRCLVCGVCWIPNGIAINTRQLGLLIDKCKSSINGSLQKMGYTTLQSRSESSAPLIEAIPALKSNFAELRQWTVRLFLAQTPQPVIPTYNSSISCQFSSPTPQRTAFCGDFVDSHNYPVYTNEPQMPSYPMANIIVPSNFIFPAPSMIQQHEMMEMRAMQSMTQAPMSPIQPPHPIQPSIGMQQPITQMSQLQPVMQSLVSQHSASTKPTINMKPSAATTETKISEHNDFSQTIIDEEESSPEAQIALKKCEINQSPTKQSENNTIINLTGRKNEDEHDTQGSQQDQIDSDFYNDPFALTPSFLINEEENIDSPPPDDPFDIPF